MNQARGGDQLIGGVALEFVPIGKETFGQRSIMNGVSGIELAIQRIAADIGRPCPNGNGVAVLAVRENVAEEDEMLTVVIPTGALQAGVATVVKTADAVNADEPLAQMVCTCHS